MPRRDTKKILFLSNDCDYFLSHRLPVAVACRENGYDVHVAGPASGSAGNITSHGFTYHSISMSGRISDPWQEFTTLREMVRLFNALRPDLVHAVAIKSVLFGSIAARLARVPALVNAVTGLGYLFISESLKARVVRSIALRGFRFGFRHGNCRVLFQNRDDSDLFTGSGVVSPDKVTIIRGSGVDVDLYAPHDMSGEPPIVVLPSRMLWDKGVGEFVEAAAILKKEGWHARFVLVGDSYLSNPASIAREKLAQWDASGVVEWWGQQNKMHEIFRQAHIVCLPSYREGLPKALIEAAACGRPIVTTDVPGCREVVIDGVNGFLVPVKDAKSLAAKLKLLISDPGLCKRMGANGRELAEGEFAVKRIVSETLRCYEELFKCRQS